MLSSWLDLRSEDAAGGQYPGRANRSPDPETCQFALHFTMRIPE